MYLAVLAVVAGQALLLASRPLLLYSALLGLGFHLFVIGYEEPALQRRYGPAYEAYRASVGRWLPRLT
jgi:protein-S-isoprenylcysteine O-methyltransferase Ste14